MKYPLKLCYLMIVSVIGFLTLSCIDAEAGRYKEKVKQTCSGSSLSYSASVNVTPVYRLKAVRAPRRLAACSSPNDYGQSAPTRLLAPPAPLIIPPAGSVAPPPAVE